MPERRARSARAAEYERRVWAPALEAAAWLEGTGEADDARDAASLRALVARSQLRIAKRTAP